MGFPCGSAGKESACSAEDLGSISGLGRSPGEEKDYPLQYSGLENSVDCIAHGVAKSQTRLSDLHFDFLSLLLNYLIHQRTVRSLGGLLTAPEKEQRLARLEPAWHRAAFLRKAVGCPQSRVGTWDLRQHLGPPASRHPYRDPWSPSQHRAPSLGLGEGAVVTTQFATGTHLSAPHPPMSQTALAGCGVTSLSIVSM